MKLTTKQAARGKWDGIISQLLGEQAISRRHTSCPICEGTDRYRYDNNRNDGDWYCNSCGTGDGFKLIMESLGIEFAEAARRIDEIVNNVEEKPFKPDIDIDKRRKSLNVTWANATDPFVAYDYLVGRGIRRNVVDLVSKDVRGIEGLGLYEGKEYIATYPAMISLIRNSKGEPISIHRTYLTPDGKQKKIMPPLETITGGCVRLGEPDDTLVLAEGIETALAAWSLTGYPAWATISAHGLAEFKSLPRHVKKVIIASDNDASFTGQAAAFTCAKYMKQRMKVETVVTMPKILEWDMVDVLNDLLVPPEGNELELSPEDETQLLRWTP